VSDRDEKWDRLAEYQRRNVHECFVQLRESLAILVRLRDNLGDLHGDVRRRELEAIRTELGDVWDRLDGAIDVLEAQKQPLERLSLGGQ